MKSKDIEKTKTQMRRGVLELCTLAIISEGETYGFVIIEKLKESELIVVEGTLYPLLTRLKKAGLLEYDWRESTSGPPRKYYQITDAGQNLLKGLLGTWQDLVKAVDKVTATVT